MADKNDSIENLPHTKGIEKMKQLAEDSDICMFVTALDQLPLDSRPMSTQKVDEQGNIWFLSDKNSNKNKHIAADNRVQLFYANKNSSEYLSIYGEAEILYDRELIKEMWTSNIAKAWFEEGADDPDISLIKVDPKDVYYWDTKHNRFVALLKIGVSIITGKTMDDGVEGKLKV